MNGTVDSAVEAVRGIADDFMTSEVHHPGYVLIPVAKFEQLREAEATLSGGRAETLKSATADDTPHLQAVGPDHALYWRAINTWEGQPTGPENSVLLCVDEGEGHYPSIGEAYFDPDAYGGTWWWANTGATEYYDSPIIETQHGAPTHWMPLPWAPGHSPSSTLREMVLTRDVIDTITHDALPDVGEAMDTQGRARVQVYIADAILSHGVVEGWRTIDSAPKDGTRFDVWVPSYAERGKGYRVSDLRMSAESVLYRYGEECPVKLAHPPTHWRSLPASPAAVEGGGA